MSSSSLVRRVVLPTAFTLLGYLSIAPFLQHLHRARGLALSELLIFVGLPILFRMSAGERAAIHGSPTTTRIKLFAFGGALGVANFFAFAGPLMALSRHFFPHELVMSTDRTASLNRLSSPQLVELFAAICLVAPFCEEYFYRSFFLGRLRALVPWPRALVVSALLFSLMHFDAVGAAALFELGLLFGALFLRGNSAWPAIGAHFANNACSAVAYLLGRLQPEPFGLAWSVTLALSGQLVFWILAWAFHRNTAAS